MLKKWLRLVVFNAALALTLVCPSVFAKDFGQFYLEYNENDWVEVPTEIPEELAVESNVLLNVKNQSILNIMTQELGRPYSKEEIKEQSKTIIGYYKLQGIEVTNSYFDDDKGMFVCEGSYASLPFEMHMYMRGSMLIVYTSMGPDIKSCFDLADQIKFK